MSSEGETVSRGIHSRVFGTNSAFSVGLRTAGEGGGEGGGVSGDICKCWHNFHFGG